MSEDQFEEKTQKKQGPKLVTRTVYYRTTFHCLTCCLLSTATFTQTFCCLSPFTTHHIHFFKDLFSALLDRGKAGGREGG